MQTGVKLPGVTEQHAQGIAEPFVKANPTVRAVLFEIRSDLPELEGHGFSFR